MNANKKDIIAFMASVGKAYFPEIQGVIFEVVRDETFEGVMGQALFGKTPKVILHYNDRRIMEPRYRLGLVPLIAHELAHYIDPVDPERVMRDRLPVPMMALWEELLKEGYAKCSLQRRNHVKV